MISNNKPNQDLKGLISALLVPYTAKGEVNEQGLDKSSAIISTPCA
nr:hypothetical protein [Rappaport israeli]